MSERNLKDEILLTIPQVAKLIHTDVNKVRGYVRSGKLKALKLGELKVRREEVDRFLREAEGLDYTDIDNIRRLENESI